ncbi:hypothetical protein FA95DRAFT_251459 [Auriscalpium vulgare]|uniref:Uncharacterized protein n=1 Tax=Auriscalpium vulgare TaxID=40419 RepID=A0ACB8RLM3_9AGAM|nr:hypothetical protein FA95DRAFT_251459 [Auriscalpium vulgare]
MGMCQVLEAPDEDRNTALFNPVLAAWNGVFRWMVYIDKLYRAEDPQHPMIAIITTTIYEVGMRREMRNLFCDTPGILEFTASVWMNGERTAELSSPVPAWNLADTLNRQPLSSAQNAYVFFAGNEGHVADSLVRGLRQAAKKHASSLFETITYLKLVSGLGVGVETLVRQALSKAGVMRAVTRAMVRIWALDVQHDTIFYLAPQLGFHMAVSFLEAGTGVDAVRQSVQEGILEASLNIGPHLNALPAQVTSLVNAIIGIIIPRYIVFRSVTEAVCKSLRALQSANREAQFADSKLQHSWNVLGELARSRERIKNTLEICASRSRATCKNCLVTGRKTSFKRCSRCHSAAYCSTQCQKAAWEAIHKAECAEISHNYLATALSHSDASFQKAVVAFDAKRLVPKLRSLAAQQYPNILLCRLVLTLDYTESAEPQYSLLDRFNESSSPHRAVTFIRYKIRLGEYEEFSILPIASLWIEGEVGGEVSGLEVEDFDVREVLDDVAERVSCVAVVRRVEERNPVTKYSGNISHAFRTSSSSGPSQPEVYR